MTMRAALALLAVVLARAQAPEPQFDAAAVARGRAAFQSTCGFCHGEDATGGRAPDLVRSTVVSHDRNGDQLGPLIRNGRPDQGMPASPALTAAQISDIATFLHAQAFAALRSARVPSDYPASKLLTGNAAAGKAYFAAHCASCHTPAGDMAAAVRKLSPIDLQQRIVYPAGGRGAADARTATITLPDGRTVEGRVAHEDEFEIAIVARDGWYQSWPRASVKLAIHDPLAAHRALTEQYTDADIHNLFAYLNTLK